MSTVAAHRHRYLLHVKFSNDSGAAFEEVYRDGQAGSSQDLAEVREHELAQGVPEDRDVPEGHQRRAEVVWHDDMAVYTSAPTLSVD